MSDVMQVFQLHSTGCVVGKKTYTDVIAADMKSPLLPNNNRGLTVSHAQSRAQVVGRAPTAQLVRT